MKQSRMFAITRDDSNTLAICAIPSSILILLISSSDQQSIERYLSRWESRNVRCARNFLKCVYRFSGHVALQITDLKVQVSLSLLCEPRRKSIDIFQDYARLSLFGSLIAWFPFFSGFVSFSAACSHCLND